MTGVATRSDVVLVRVLISDLPHLHADVVARLVADQHDMVVVGDPGGDSPAHLAPLSADVILVSPVLSDDEVRDLARLHSSADSGVLAIDAARGEILGVVTVPDDHAWPEKIIAAIRSAAPHRSPRHRRQLP
jgi:hypothetical protein